MVCDDPIAAHIRKKNSLVSPTNGSQDSLIRGTTVIVIYRPLKSPGCLGVFLDPTGFDIGKVGRSDFLLEDEV